MRKIAAFAVAALALVLALGASADSNGGNAPMRDHGHGHWFKRACDLPGAKTASCNSFVVTDDAGVPLAGGSPPAGAYGPVQLRTAYGLLGASGDSSQTIGIVDAYNDPTAEADLATFSAQYGLPSCTTANGCFTKVNQNGSTTNLPATDAGWALEISLDIETAHAICPGCKILLVEASSSYMSSLGTAVNRAVTMGADVVSNSYGGGESSGETSWDTSYYKHPGVVVTASSGDGGYGVEYPAASQYVTAVGGTTLTLNGDNTWKAETAWADAGSGCSKYEPKPAWQTDGGCSKRTVADVSADADPNTGAAVYDSTTYQGQSGWFQVGGTSLSSPLVAAVYALTGTEQNASYGSTPYGNTGALHDVTSGSNGSCGGSYLCTAVAGFDGPTGLGTPNGLAAFTAGSPQPDFTVGVSPSSYTATAGTDATYTVSVGSVNGFASSVGLSVAGVPSGATAGFSPASVGAPGSSTLTVHTGTAAAGTYTLTITGTSGTTHSTTATLVVKAAAAGDFSISVTPSSAHIADTGTSTYTVTITPKNGFNGAVTLSATGLPVRGTGSFSPNPTTSTSTFTLTVNKTPPNRSKTITITGTSGSLSHSAKLKLTT